MAIDQQKQDAKRDEVQDHGLTDDILVPGDLVDRRRDVGSDGISGLPIIGRLFGTVYISNNSHLRVGMLTEPSTHTLAVRMA